MFLNNGNAIDVMPHTNIGQNILASIREYWCQIEAKSKEHRELMETIISSADDCKKQSVAIHALAEEIAPEKTGYEERFYKKGITEINQLVVRCWIMKLVESEKKNLEQTIG